MEYAVVVLQVTTKLNRYPAMIVEHESANVRRVLRMMNDTVDVCDVFSPFCSSSHSLFLSLSLDSSQTLPKQKLAVNPHHPVMKQLDSLRQSDAPTARLIAEQIYDNALIAAGLLDDPRSMLPRIQSLLEKALTSLPFRNSVPPPPPASGSPMVEKTEGKIEPKVEGKIQPAAESKPLEPEVVDA